MRPSLLWIVDKKRSVEKRSSQNSKKIFLEAETRRSESILCNTDNNSFIVFDRGVEDTLYVTELASLRSKDLYEAMKNLYYREILKVRSGLVILLNASLPVLRSRIASRASKDPSRGSDREDYFTLFYSRYVDWYRLNVSSCMIIDVESLTPKQVADLAAQAIHEKYISRG